MVSFLRQHFNVLLLAFIYVSLLATTIWMTFTGADSEALNWIRTQTGTLQGALLAIITGRLMYLRKDNSNGGEKDL